MISKLAEKACDLRFSPWCNFLKGAVHRHELPGPLRGAGENHDLYLQLFFNCIYICICIYAIICIVFIFCICICICIWFSICLYLNLPFREHLSQPNLWSSTSSPLVSIISSLRIAKQLINIITNQHVH